MIRSILWFRQDLRLHDNEALLEALRNSDEVIPVYIFDTRQYRSVTQYGTQKTGYARTQFLLESLTDLRKNLQALGSELIIRIGDPVEIVTDLAAHFQAYYIYCNRERTREEVQVQDRLEKKMWAIGREVRYSRGKMLYYTSDLPFPITHCPDSFAVFKKEIEQVTPIRYPLDTPLQLPGIPGEIESGFIPSIYDLLPDNIEKVIQYFKGGESNGIRALEENNLPHPPLFMANEGTLLSPWIASGCLSPKKIYYASLKFENGVEEIQHHLLYRDYLRLMGKKYGDRIFYRSGIKGISRKTRLDSDALVKWKNGSTGVSIVDAAMHQLNQTGWLSDSLRRLVTGYFIKVLHIDWRLGAAYFEEKLIDYDPCTNWVSWLNMAGLGPDTREDRVINYDAVGKRLDPEGAYINAWMA